ncbi:MAG: FAD-dependent oxidoreductase [Peptococcaceae bacterium]|nr:FAD-dependent oxidoreductase [Peptococcaceae bacterium]
MKPLYKQKYPHVFEPLTVGKNKNITFKNRIFQAPVGVGATGGGADDGRMNLIGVDFWTGIARSGFAGFTLPMEVPHDGSHDGVYNVDEDKHNYMNMHLMQRSIHAYGAKSFAEIIHGGPCMIRKDIPLVGADNRIYNGRPVKGMDEKDMEEAIALYVEQAKLIVRGGFDGIMLHFAHGWLPHDFLSPLSNHRTDEYGGSVENRCRFPLAILKAVREAIGPDICIELRLNGSDDMPGGITPEDAAQQVLIFQEYADMIHISCGTRIDVTSRTTQMPTSYFPGAHNAYASEIVKKTPGVKIPIGTVGGIYTVAIAEEVIAKGQADYVLTARSAIADPDFLIKVREGREEDIRPCLRCDLCLDHGRRKSHFVGKELVMASDVSFDRRCAVNPTAMQGATKKRFPAPTRLKKIAVIGGGVAGMNAALSAADRGHEVILYEKTNKLGGQALLSDRLWFKQEMKLYHEWLERQVKKHPKIYIMMNTEVTREMMEDSDPDAVIVAVGAHQFVPPIPGIEKATMAFDVFGNEDKLGKKVVIVGGGSIGCELGIHLNELGHESTVIEMTHFLCGSMELTLRLSTLQFMEKRNVTSRLDTKVTSIEDNGVWIEDEDGNKEFIEADSVIISAGTRENAEERDQFIDVSFDVINIGDCQKASDIAHAVESGYDAGAIL